MTVDRKDRIDETIDPEKEDYLLIEDLLTICGHSAIGLSIEEAREIDSQYGKYIDRPL